MTYLDAACHILQQASQPLRYEEIAERALAKQLISPQGLTRGVHGLAPVHRHAAAGIGFTRADKGACGIVAQTAGR